MNTGTPPHGRLLSIDAMRACALVGMVLDHFQLYFGNDAAASTWPYFLFEHALGDWGAAVFLMLTGMSQALSHQRRESRGEEVEFRTSFVRGSYLFVVGLVMLALTWGPSQLWQWDILTLMGLATIVLHACRRLPSWVILLLGAGLAVAAPALRSHAGFLDAWGGAMRGVPLISDYLPGFYVEPVSPYGVLWSAKPILMGFLANGYFPVFPWLAFPLLGFVSGRRVVGGRAKGDLRLVLPAGTALATAGLALAFAGRASPPSAAVSGLVAPLSFAPDSFSMVLFQAGMALLCYGIFFYFLDVRRAWVTQPGPFARMVARTSRFSLSIYFTHYLLIGWTLAGVYLATGQYRRASLMDDSLSLACGVAAVGALEVLVWIWEKAQGRYSLEWVLARVSHRGSQRNGVEV